MLHSVSITRPVHLSLDILARWRAALAAQQNWASPFLTPEFACAVARERDDARILLAQDHQGLLGILCIHKRPGGYARPLGAPIADHQAFVTEAGFDADLAQVLRAADLKTLHFTGLNDAQAQLCGIVSGQQASLLADLSKGPEAYFAKQEKRFHRHFKKMRQRRRGAQRDYGTVSIRTDCRDAAAFEMLLRWKRAQYRRTRKCDVLAAGWIENLLRQLWQSRGRVRAVLHVLELGGRPAAAEIGLVCQDTYHSWIAAFDPQMARCSPGLLLVEGILRRAGDLGITTMDMGCGHAHYKKYYANAAIMLGQGQVLADGGATRSPGWRIGAALMAQAPQRLVHSLDFMAACHPDWMGRLRGVAQRLGHALG